MCVCVRSRKRKINIYSLPNFNCDSVRVQNKLIIPGRAMKRKTDRKKERKIKYNAKLESISREGKKHNRERMCSFLLLATLLTVVATVSF